jgi:hypothetical protein
MMLVRTLPHWPLITFQVSADATISAARDMSPLVLCIVLQLLLFYCAPLRIICAQLARLPGGATLAHVLLVSFSIFEGMQGRLRSVHAAQISRGLPLDGSLLDRLSTMTGLLVPITTSCLVDATDRAIVLKRESITAATTFQRYRRADYSRSDPHPPPQEREMTG